jgi:hypothetical protein
MLEGEQAEPYRDAHYRCRDNGMCDDPLAQADSKRQHEMAEAQVERVCLLRGGGGEIEGGMVGGDEHKTHDDDNRCGRNCWREIDHCLAPPWALPQTQRLEDEHKTAADEGERKSHLLRAQRQQRGCEDGRTVPGPRLFEPAQEKEQRRQKEDCAEGVAPGGYPEDGELVARMEREEERPNEGRPARRLLGQLREKAQRQHVDQNGGSDVKQDIGEVIAGGIETKLARLYWIWGAILR